MPAARLSRETLQASVDAYMRFGGSWDAAAAALNIPKSTFQRHLDRAKMEGLWDGQRPRPAAVPNIVAEQMARAGGDPARASHGWIIEKTETGAGLSTFWKREETHDALADFARGLAETMERAEPVPAPAGRMAALCTLYTLTDAHVGMLAWHKEGGADWNLKEARRVLDGCFRLMLEQAPPADVGVVAVLGDWLHFDGLEAVTPTSRHHLDADTRFSKMAQTGAAVLRGIVDAALAKHSRVHLVCAEGNHDIASAAWMRILFNALYEYEPRLTVSDSELPFYAYQHGETMLAWHHGHTVKPAQLPLVMAAQFREMWGSVRHCFIHTGHKHHSEMKEHAGAVVEQHPTLAARDAYAARHGWQAMRRAAAITYHETHGEVGRVMVTPEMVA